MMSVIEIPVFFVDDTSDSIDNFQTRCKDLSWIKKFTECNTNDIKEALLSSRTLSVECNNNLEKYIEETGLSKSELEGLIQLDLGWLSQIPQLEDLSFRVTCFQMNSDEKYHKALSAIQESPDFCFLILDAYWNVYRVNNNILSHQINTFINTPAYNQSCLGAYDLAYQFLSKDGNRYLVKATTAGSLKKVEDLLNLPDLERHIIDSDSVAAIGAPANIAKILQVWYENIYASPVGKLRCKADFWSESQRQNAWFFSNTAQVPHDFSTSSELVQKVQGLIYALVKVDMIDYLCYEGFKSFCLKPSLIGPHTVYAVAKLASAQKVNFKLISNCEQYSGKIPILKSCSNVWTCDLDFAETFFEFFTEFYKNCNNNCHISFNENTCCLTITSSHPVASSEYTDRNTKTLLNAVCWHLKYFNENGRWSTQHRVSLPFAKCIQYGGWGLKGSNQIKIKDQQGPFLILMKEKEICFTWNNSTS